MKQLFIVVLAIFIFTSCQQQKIGYVDNGKVINEYQEKIDIEARYKVEIEAYQKRRDSLGRAFQSEVAVFQAKEKTMSAKKKQEVGQQLGQKQQMLQRQLQAEEQNISKRSQTEIDTLISKVRDYVKDYGKSKGYTFILGTSENNASVMYGKDEFDITDVVSSALNSTYKAITPAAEVVKEVVEEKQE